MSARATNAIGDRSLDEVNGGVVVAISLRLCDGRRMNVVSGLEWRVENYSQGYQPCKQKKGGSQIMGAEGGSLLLPPVNPIPVASVGPSFPSPSAAD